MKTPTFARPKYPQTPDSARRWFRTHGICVKHWAEAQGFSRFDVIDLLRGRMKGNFGRAHLVAVALGLKQDPERRAA